MTRLTRVLMLVPMLLAWPVRAQDAKPFNNEQFEQMTAQVALVYTDAQTEYRQRDWSGDGIIELAKRGLSSPGRRDGLYSASLSGEPESPLGPEFAEAKVGQPYHGYLYKILIAQGADAPGGARDHHLQSEASWTKVGKSR